MESKKLIKMLRKDGWELVRITGDHHHYRYPYKKGIVTVPHPRKDIPKGTLSSIYRQAGWK
ncbi:type II toxin-antitoxin system HicA family toxin [Lactobacillus kalixensis]|uniref:type II toxin-antitoxin system HicA family toxin n=1 Tax=Lactobacillus kalixensis TaxID=227944 RepID=UPI00070963FC|nr:type II toxin-antitoxin system HicA family toxin [Lactobacillus kalixensis]